MKTMIVTAAIVAAAGTLQLPVPASASDGAEGCSTRMLAGRWVFATGIGHQATAPEPGDITAIGTMNIQRNGDVEGAFDVTFEGARFAEGVPYSGTVEVNEDCTGTLSFVTGTGAARTDSIAVLNRYQFWGMSQDPSNLWTYQVRRLSGRAGFAD